MGIISVFDVEEIGRNVMVTDLEIEDQVADRCVEAAIVKSKEVTAEREAEKAAEEARALEEEAAAAERMEPEADESGAEESDEPESEEAEKSKGKRGPVYPLRIVKHEQERHVNLLYTEQNGIGHYSTITNFSGLFWSHYNKDRTKYFHCYSCLHGFKA